MTESLRVENLYKNFDNFTLKDISFSLPRGYIMGFIGPNGSGKTTTIKLIMNLLKKDRGTIEVLGLDNVQFEREIKNKIGFVSDTSYFYEQLSINRMSNLIAPFYQNWQPEVYQYWLKRFELNPKQKIVNLSRGMKTKYALTVALSHQPELLILDEPTSGLDPVFRRELMSILLEFIQTEKCSVFFSTHITSDLERVADYITLINNGELIFSMEQDKIFEEFLLIKGSSDNLTEELKKSLIGWERSQFGFEGLIKQSESFDTENFILETPTLEDIMYFFKVRRD